MKMFTSLWFSLVFVAVSVSAVSVEFDCPAKVAPAEVFVCSVVSSSVDKVYDLKVDLKKDGKTITKVWDPAKESWGSAYYYVPRFITQDDEQKLRLKISVAGEFVGKVKVRNGSVEEVSSFTITVADRSGDNVDEDDEPKGEKSKINKTEKVSKPVVRENASPIELGTISLGGANSSAKSVVVYESKEYKLLSYAPYAFSVFLIFLIIIIVAKR